MKGISNQFSSIEQVTNQYLNQNTVKNKNAAADVSFEDILREKRTGVADSELKFSKHATLRLMNRNITLTPEQNIRLEDGVKEARKKGIRDSLVLVDSLAFIVNVPNSTVVTAMDQTETKNNVFTNIDGAVIM